MFFFREKVIGIDFHDYSAQVVEFKIENKRIVLSSYNRMQISPTIIQNGEIKEEEELKKILVELLKTANPQPITAKDVAILFPSSKTFTHVFTLPASLNEDEIRQTIPIEAETVIPFGLEDIYWDIRILGKSPQISKKDPQRQRVLFVAVMKQVADQYARLLESIDLVPFLFATIVESLEHAVKNQIDPLQSTLIIHFSALSTDYIIVKNNTIEHVYSGNEGGHHLINKIATTFNIDELILLKQREQNEWEDRYQSIVGGFLKERMAEAKNVVSNWESQNGLEKSSSLQGVLLTGEYVNIPGLIKAAHENFSQQMVSIGDPKLGLEINATKFLPLHKERGGPIPYSIYFTNPMGVAFRALRLKKYEGMNLLPPRLKENLLRKRLLLTGAVISMVITGVMLFLATYFLFLHQNLNYERINLEIQKEGIENKLYGTRYQEIREAINQFNTEVAELSRIGNALFSLPETLRIITDRVPAGVELTRIQFYDENLVMVISGIAETREELLILQENLKKTDFIKEVIAPISNYDQKSKLSFQLEIHLEFKELPQEPNDTKSK
ncbi:MAG: PilM [uncultured bacterium]|nr:MAG: PilM [uncultured bacterium]